MKKLIFAILFAALIPVTSNATVEFVGADWDYGNFSAETIQSIGIVGDRDGDSMVVLNLINGRQVKMSGAHAALGLSLTNFEGKCIKINAGLNFKSVSFILNCN